MKCVEGYIVFVSPSFHLPDSPTSADFSVVNVLLLYYGKSSHEILDID